MSNLTITRDSIGEIVRHLRELEEYIGDTPHRIAVEILRHTREIELIATDILPGGEMQGCECCDRVLGADEVHIAGDVWMCDACIVAAREDGGAK